MIAVMVTGVGSNIGQGVIKAIRMSKMDAKIIGTDIHPLSAGLFRSDKGYVVPPATSEDLLEKVVDICNREDIDIILIGSDLEVPFFSAKREDIEKKTKAIVLVSNSFIVNTFHDKWETAKFLSANGFSYPETSLGTPESITRLRHELKFPIVIKPRIGAGSNNVFIANNQKQMEGALAYVQSPIIQEFISGEEFTSGVFFDNESTSRGCITMKRELKSGTTYRAVIDDFPEVNNHVIRISKLLSRYGAVGSINIQSRYSSGQFYTIEINPRFSGTTVIRAKFNFNEPESALRHFVLKEELDNLRPSKGIVMRYWEEVYTGLEEVKRIEENGFIEQPNATIMRAL